MEKIIYAGSFDIFTNGHLYVLKEGLKIAEKVCLLVANNSTKKHSFFSLEERKDILSKVIKENNLEDKVIIETCSSEYVSTWAEKNNITHMIRGLRGSADFDSEKILARANNELIGSIQTLFVISPSNVEFISSSFVKSLIGPVYWPYKISNLIPTAVLEKLCTKYVKDFVSKLDINIDIDSLLNFYKMEDRSYHNICHICNMLSYIGIESITPEEFVAIIFHDLVQNVKDKIDEEESFIVGEKHCKDVSIDMTKVKELVMSTRHPNNTSNNVKEADLCILWSDSKTYSEYMFSIKNEYETISLMEFYEGRAKFLKSFKENVHNFVPKNYVENTIKNISYEINCIILAIDLYLSQSHDI